MNDDTKLDEQRKTKRRRVRQPAQIALDESPATRPPRAPSFCMLANGVGRIMFFWAGTPNTILRRQKINDLTVSSRCR